jgi:hypothetical protein
MEKGTCDRELYPALVVTLAAGIAAFLIWRFALNAPAFPACWFFKNWHIYCPACGGTRAVIALAHGQIMQACYWNPAVPVGAVSVAAYLLSQTLWRLRGRRGWVLRYSDRWLWAFLLLMAVNCAVRNLLWFGFGIAM